MIATIKLSVAQVLAALDDTSRFYASRFYNQPGDQLTTQQMLAYYIAHAEIGMTIVGFDVNPSPQLVLPFKLDLAEHDNGYRRPIEVEGAD